LKLQFADDERHHRKTRSRETPTAILVMTDCLLKALCSNETKLITQALVTSARLRHDILEIAVAFHTSS